MTCLYLRNVLLYAAILETKNASPLQKKPKAPKADRVTYRQESVGIAVLEFVQNLLVEDADVSGVDIVPTIVEVSCMMLVSAA